jgi:hypothetical protein
MVAVSLSGYDNVKELSGYPLLQQMIIPSNISRTSCGTVTESFYNVRISNVCDLSLHRYHSIDRAFVQYRISDNLKIPLGIYPSQWRFGLLAQCCNCKRHPHSQCSVF